MTKGRYPRVCVLWGSMFAVASALYPLSIDDRALFGSIRAVVLAFATTASAVLGAGLPGAALIRRCNALWTS